MKGFSVMMAGMLSVLVVACGGSGSSPVQTEKSVSPGDRPAAMTRAEFEARADEVCRRFRKNNEDTSDRIDALLISEDPDVSSQLYDLVSAASSELTGDLEAIGYEGEGSKKLEEYVEALNGIVDQFAVLRDDLEDGGESSLFAIGDEINRLNRKTERIARELGIEKCVFPV